MVEKEKKKLTFDEAVLMLAGFFRYVHPTDISTDAAAMLMVMNGYSTETPGLYEAVKKIIDEHGWDYIVLTR
jgi:hypothetical protein